MKTAIVINLDYETKPIVKCQQLWTVIETRMSDAGFVKVSRRFVIPLDAEAAGKQARAVIDGIESEYLAKGHSAMAYIRDFYAVPYEAIINLAGPVSHAIEVDMMASGAFQKFFT